MTDDSAGLIRLERHLGWLLVAGVATSAILLSFGLLILLAAPDRATGGHFLSGGLLVLIATPILRVVVSMIEYVRMREWSFVVITLVVLVQLCVGVVYAWRR
jgi:uncharacterized membrane protein